MAYNPLPVKPYTKYIYSNSDEFTSADPDLIKTAIGSLGYDPQASDAMFADWSRLMGVPLTSGATDSSSTGVNGGGSFDYRAMIESDPYYLQAKADMSAQGISDASQRAAALKRALADWGVIPDFAAAGDKMGLSSTALGFLGTDIDDRTRRLAAENEAQGLSMHSRLGKANTDNISAIRNALAARGMYESGELGYGLTENAQSYKQASTDAERQVLGTIEEVSGRFVQSERERTRAVADAMMAAAQRAAMLSGSSDFGGGGRVDYNDFMYGGSVPGYSPDQLWGAAVAGAPQGAQPMHIMNQGMIQNGMVSVKYKMPDGTTNTIWVPLPASSTTTTPTSTPTPAPAPTPTTVAAGPGAGVTPYYAPRPTTVYRQT